MENKMEVKVCDIVYAIGNRFSLDTREIALMFFDGDIKKAYSTLNGIAGLYAEDVNDAHKAMRRQDGKLACLVWQVSDDMQGWTMEDCINYCKKNGDNPNKEV